MCVVVGVGERRRGAEVYTPGRKLQSNRVWGTFYLRWGPFKKWSPGHELASLAPWEKRAEAHVILLIAEHLRTLFPQAISICSSNGVLFWFS